MGVSPVWFPGQPGLPSVGGSTTQDTLLRWRECLRVTRCPCVSRGEHVEQPRGFGDPPAAPLAVPAALAFGALRHQSQGSMGPSLPSPPLTFYLSAPWPRLGVCSPGDEGSLCPRILESLWD